MKKQLAVSENIENKIFIIRGKSVMIDRDLAALYGVETKALNRAVKRNITRFPEDFMFQLTKQEKEEVVTNWHHLSSLRFSHTKPYVFTEMGVAMLSSVLNSERAININIKIMRAFVAMRQYALKAQEDGRVANRLLIIEKALLSTDKRVDDIIEVLNEMLQEDGKKEVKKIGFV